ncbi:hypothetical protein [Acidibrevibacterium fodinaquatile]|uniref:hypothetical protein n=1 Tax=Acidibrevibacterium fodinaquatile TaxID=1969806 RepID=UPI001F077CFD|nr:hypothetical protein [Acidibrevibacterium fodinaquatile]
MAASRFLEGKPETLSHLPPSVIYRLAAPSAPADLVADVLGGGLDPRDIKKRLDDADRARREAEWHARLAQKRFRRRVAHLHPTAPEPAVAPAHAESNRPAELAKLAARLFESGLARDVLEILPNAERRTALAGLLAERDR